VARRHPPAARSGPPPRIAVIVPAHDEGEGLLPTLADLKPQLGAGDRLLVVADNCSDTTAAVATAAGVEVTERNDPLRVGKGYALGWGLDYLAANPPDMVVFVDADCRLQADVIAGLKATCDALQRPVQAAFMMTAAANSPINHSFAEFAWIVKNWVRPLGLTRLNGPVQLMGTGMIFPWGAIRSVPLASGNIVEDLKLGLDLAAAGKAPVFLPSVTVTSEFPLSATGTDTQRKRWVHGHVGLIVTAVPRLLLQAIARRNPGLLVLTLDLAVPPLSLLGLLILGVLVLAVLGALAGASPVPAVLALVNAVLLGLALWTAWSRFGRDSLPVTALAAIGPLIGQKLALYGGMLRGRTSAKWIRTDRSK
jgi:cellulose synthase/poly-beta-1,6-N-acetylglucosamine synthase-like glycosyltransferase